MMRRIPGPFAVALLLLLPLCTVIDGGLGGGNVSRHIGLPTVRGGDEPHYMVMLSSLLQDGDFDVSNNYLASHRGGLDAGRPFGRFALDHHVAWWIGGHKVGWHDIYETPADKWNRDAEGSPLPTRRADAPVDVAGLPEYSGHPPGSIFLLAALLWPVSGTAAVEPLALLISALAIILAMFLFRRLIAPYASDPRALNLATALVFLATPAWHYGRTLYTESFLILFTVGAYLLARGGRALPAGLLLGLGMLMKPPFVLIGLPLGIAALARRKWREAALLTIGPAIATITVLLLNDRWWGSPWHTAQTFVTGSFVDGTVGLLISRDHGIVPYAPVVLVAVALWPRFLREHRAEGLQLLAASGLYFGLMAWWSQWHGGWCYGPRLVMPILPLLLVPLVGVYAGAPFTQSRAWRIAVPIVCGLSVVINVIGVVGYWHYWGVHPLFELAKSLE